MADGDGCRRASTIDNAKHASIDQTQLAPLPHNSIDRNTTTYLVIGSSLELWGEKASGVAASQKAASDIGNRKSACQQQTEKIRREILANISIRFDNKTIEIN
jgi:predicted transglutaminase-like protease